MTRPDTSSAQAPEAPEAATPGFSPVGNERLLRLRRRLGLGGAHGPGLVWLALLLTAIAYLPLAAWAIRAGRFWQEASGESLLQHFAVHARFLLAIPLLVLSEWPMHTVLRQVTGELLDGGFIPAAQHARYLELTRRLAAWRDALLPLLFMVLVAILWSVLDAPNPQADASAWGVTGDGTPGFGLWWGAYVARPIFLILLLLACWRLLLVTVLFFGIGRLDLALVPSHPDHMGGLQFVERLPAAWGVLTLTLSLVVSSQWAHNVLYHGQPLQGLKWQALTFVIVWSLIALLPLFALAPVMLRTRQRALVTYGDLVGRQGRLVHRRWIKGETVEDSEGLLDSPDIGCVADTSAIFDAVEAMRPAPVGKRALVFILVPLAIPMLLLVMQKVPLLEQLGKLAKALV